MYIKFILPTNVRNLNLNNYCAILVRRISFLKPSINVLEFLRLKLTEFYREINDHHSCGILDMKINHYVTQVLLNI